MCGRYGLFQPQPEIERRFSAEIEFDYEPRYNIAPETDIPVVRNDEPEVIDTVEWGLVAPWNNKMRIINARSESAAEERTFKEAFAERRCLIPASGYYEWQDQMKGPKQPFLIHRDDDEPFAFAGLWNPSNGHERPTAVILTTDPSSSIEHIHDRMPVMFDRDDDDRWLESDDQDDLQALLVPYPSDELEADAVSTKVNNPTYDGPDVIEPVGTDQSGLEEFGN